MRFRPATTGLLLLVGLTGCSDPKTTKVPLAPEYPVRNDFLVTGASTASAQKWYEPGLPPLVRLEANLSLKKRLLADEVDRVRRAEPTLADDEIVKKAKAGLDRIVTTAIPDTEQQTLLSEIGTGVGSKVLDSRNYDSAERAEFAKGLTAIFGTPTDPKIDASTDAIKAAVTELRLEQKTLQAGEGLYRTYCLNCHGETGNGAGPGGKYLIPLPRDYRRGLFKFVSADPAKLGYIPKPRRADLYQTIHKGLAGAPMPAFTALAPEQIDNIISYVMFLSLRGETEFQAMRANILNQDDIPDALKEQFKAILPRWVASEKNPIVPDRDLSPLDEKYFTSVDFTDENKVQFFDSVLRGYYIFNGQDPTIKLDPTASTASVSKNCNGCHIGYGKAAPYQYDEWGSLVRPRNLTVAVLRGGRKPSDIYNRIHGGIHGSGMPSHYDLFKQSPDDKVKNVNKMWDVIHFVQVLSETNRRRSFKDRFNIDLEAE